VIDKEEKDREKFTTSITKKEISNVRRHYNLREIRKGYRFCMKCELKFYSFDLANIRQCDNCRKYRE